MEMCHSISFRTWPQLPEHSSLAEAKAEAEAAAAAEAEATRQRTGATLC